MNIILIPIFNDWKSLNQLLFQINENADQNDITQILIINDCSTKEIDIDRTHLGKIQKIKILTLKQNLGSQKSIALGLNYLKKLNSNFRLCSKLKVCTWYTFGGTNVLCILSIHWIWQSSCLQMCRRSF